MECPKARGNHGPSQRIKEGVALASSDTRTLRALRRSISEVLVVSAMSNQVQHMGARAVEDESRPVVESPKGLAMAVFVLPLMGVVGRCYAYVAKTMVPTLQYETDADG